ncbi:Calvin cycle protein CP12 [Synechocystis sp. PCC 7509]|uniref:Calvin cycle protein CP12 n=1 Tax=Synechocystis sp. PCC 7509 TaxID=927677 RepID=UPI0002AC27F2|nr:Calvin cycle protein CP12 [Synechocystis sp. PCC 7509]
MSNINQQIEQEREQARNTCAIEGETSPECAAGWDVVEELQAEAAHQRQVKPKTSLERYCDDNPGADECRLYEE